MPDQPDPMLGRRVHYVLNQSDADAINDFARQGARNRARVGQVLPAMVVAVFGPAGPTVPMVNLQVFLDGDGSYWATSRSQGEDAGQWRWAELT